MNNYEQKLLEEKKRLTDELGNIGRFDNESHEWQAQSLDVEDSDADMNDNADRFEDYEEKSSLVVPLEERLKEVEDALARILENTFGKCSICGGEIEKGRLDANPAAKTCVVHME